MYEPFDSDFSPELAWEEPPSALPPGLGVMAPGVELAKVLATLDPSSLSSHERITVIAACRRMVSHYQALSYREIWTLVGAELEEARTIAREIDLPAQLQEAAFFVTTELGAALHLSTRAAQNEVSRALGLERAQSVFEALLRGKLDLYRAGMLIDRTCHLPDPDQAWVVSQVLVEAEGLTASQIRARVDRLCYLANPEEAKLRYGEAVKNRYVEVKGNEFGTATLEGRTSPRIEPRPLTSGSPVSPASSSARAKSGAWTKSAPISYWICCWGSRRERERGEEEESSSGSTWRPFLASPRLPESFWGSGR